MLFLFLVKHAGTFFHYLVSNSDSGNVVKTTTKCSQHVFILQNILLWTIFVGVSHFKNIFTVVKTCTSDISWTVQQQSSNSTINYIYYNFIDLSLASHSICFWVHCIHFIIMFNVLFFPSIQLLFAAWSIVTSQCVCLCMRQWYVCGLGSPLVTVFWRQIDAQKRRERKRGDERKVKSRDMWELCLHL